MALPRGMRSSSKISVSDFPVYSPNSEQTAQPLNVIALAPEVEALLGSALVQTSLGTELQLSPQVRQQFLERLEAAVHYCWQEGYHRTALLVDPRIRRHLHRLIERSFPRLPVLSYAEVAPGFQIQILQTVYL